MKLAAGFLWTLLAAAALAGEKHEPRISVRLSQSVGTAPVYVRVTATVRDERQELRCPGWRIEYGDGCASAQQSDCDPYGPEEDRPKRWTVTPPRPHVFRQAGDYEVTVAVLGQGDDVLDLRGSARLVVTGPDPLGERTSARAR